jgi:hypothetical protein
MGFADISTILWNERELLELLLFKLDEEQLLLAAGRTRWLSRATNEVEIVLERIRQAELVRSVKVDAVAGQLGLDPNPSLGELAAAAPEPWGELFDEHRAAFLALTSEITTLAKANRQLLKRSVQAVEEVLGSLGGEQLSLYSPNGVTRTRSSRVIDEVL